VKTFLLVSANQKQFVTQNYEKEVKFVGAVFKPVKTFLLVSADEGFFQPETETRNNW
jgi:hypothetical protein